MKNFFNILVSTLLVLSCTPNSAGEDQQGGHQDIKEVFHRLIQSALYPPMTCELWS